MKAIRLAGSLAAACVLLVLTAGRCLGDAGREIPVPAGGYPKIQPVKAGDAQPRIKSGQPVKVPTYTVADAGSFDADASVVLNSFDSVRGFETVYMGISSSDPKRGARVAVYSFASRKVVTLLADVNTLIEGAAGNERLSQSTIAGDFCRFQNGQKVYFATGQTKPKPEFAGGHLIEFDVAFKSFRDLGILAPGGSVKSLAGLDRTHLLAVVEMAGSGETRVYQVTLVGGVQSRGGRSMIYEPTPQSQPAATIEVEDTQVRDVVDFWPAGQNAWYLSGRQAPLRIWHTGEDRPAENPQPVAIHSGPDGQDPAKLGPAYWITGFDRGFFPGQSVLLEAQDGPYSLVAAPKELAPLIADTRPECVAWIRCRHWVGPAYPDSPQRQGVLYMARSGQAGAADLAVYAAAEKTPRHYPIVDAASGKPMQKPLGMVLNTLNDLLVVGEVNGQLRAAEVDDVFLDEVIAMDDALAQKLAAADGRPIVKVTAYSLTALDVAQDRPYDALTVASDGTVYGGTMPHHPTASTLIVRYDPKAEALENLGYIDALAGQNKPTDVPSMMHSAPVQVGQYMCFTGQDPFYGSAWRFPELPAKNAYAGSHVIGFNLKTHVLRDFGIPEAGLSMFWNGADANSDWLYLRSFYERGPMYRINLATGKVDDLELNCPSHIFIIAPDGTLYYSDHGSLIAFDPQTHQKEPILDSWDAQWMKGQDGQEEALALAGDQVVSFNTKTHAVRKLMKIEMPNALGGDQASGYGVICQAHIIRPQGMRLTHLVTARLEDKDKKDHGFLMDQKGRICSEINAVAIGNDNTIYAIGQFWPKVGDPVALRERPPYRDLGDDCFIVVKGLKP